MELVKTIISLNFSEAINPWLDMRSIIRNIGEKPTAEIEGQPLVLDLKDKKQRVILHIKAFEFIQEGISSIKDSVDTAIDKLVKLNGASKIPQINKIGCNSIFIEPYALPFHELLLLMKDRFLIPSIIVDPTTDIGLIFDQIEGDVLKHSQTGPMGKEQLLGMYLHYGRDRIPDDFVFLNLEYTQKKEFEFDAEYVRKFIEAAGQWQNNQAELVFNYLKKGKS